MSNTYTGTGGASGLEVRTIDLATDLFGIDIIEVSNGTLVAGASPNIARITTGGGGGGGVTDIGFGTTGLTPAALTSGAVTVAGTLVAVNGGTSFNTYATGDIIYASAANTLAKLTAGTNTHVLTLAGGVPTWAAPTGGIGGTIAAGQVAFGTAADTIGGDADFTFDNITGLIVQGTQATIESIDTTNDYVVSIFGGGGPQINFGQLPNKAAYMEISAAGGRNIIDTKVRDFEISGSNNNLMYLDQGDGFVGIGDIYTVSNLPTNTLIVGKEDAGTNTVLYPLTISRNSTGTAAVGLGVGLEFESEGPQQAGVNYVGSIIESVSTAGNSAGTTRYDIVLKNYNGAAASEVARFTSTGGFNTTTSIAGGTTVGIDPGAGGTVTVGGTGGVTTTNGPITAVGVTGAVSAQTTVTGGTGVVATTGNVAATVGAVTAGTSVSATTTVTAGTGITATTGDIGATLGNVTADFAPGDGTAGNFVATRGYRSQIAGQRLNAAIGAGADLADPTLSVYGAVQELSGDTYTLGPYGGGTPAVAGATATYLCTAATVTCSVDGVAVTAVTGGGATGTSFICPQFESFTIYCLTAATFFVFGNVTVL